MNNEVKADFSEILERSYVLLHRKFQIYYFPHRLHVFNKPHNKIVYRLRFILMVASLHDFRYFLE